MNTNLKGNNMFLMLLLGAFVVSLFLVSLHGGYGSSVAFVADKNGAPCGVQIFPSGVSIAEGTSKQFKVAGVLRGKIKADITKECIYASSNASVAVISSEGRAIGLKPGNTLITAIDKSSGCVSSTVLNVTGAKLASIRVTPVNTSVPDGGKCQFIATGIFSDNNTQDLTDAVSWTSADISVATVSNNEASSGLAKSVDIGTTVISATDPTTGIKGTSSINIFSRDVPPFFSL